jgi:pSer/pThr/pTyr-binding forkhead associated (FHA) protein
MRIHLQLLNGEKIDRTLELESFIIGRSPKCDVVVPHEGMSRQHCQIELINGEIFITDLASTNGVLIDGVKIEPNQKTPYATYLSLAFGAVQSMQIEITEPTNTRSLPSMMTPRKESNRDSLMNHVPAAMTKTKNMPELPKTSSSLPSAIKEKSKQERVTNFRSIFINILCLAIIGAAAWWFMDSKNNAKIEDSAGVEETYVE